MTITKRSTKSELLSAYNELKTKSDSSVVTKDAVINTAKIVCKELAALASDVYHLGAWSRKRFDHLVSVFRKARVT
jgi:hypothetical protein